jgi:uncharacterized protein
MRAKGHIPVRTCISCGRKRSKIDLIKLITDDENRLVRDNSGRIKGRGGYVCNAQPCLERLLINKHLNRHFRAESNIRVTREFLGLPFENK